MLAAGPPAPLPEPHECKQAADEQRDQGLGNEPRSTTVREQAHPRESSQRPPTV